MFYKIGDYSYIINKNLYSLDVQGGSVALPAI